MYIYICLYVPHTENSVSVCDTYRHPQTCVCITSIYTYIYKYYILQEKSVSVSVFQTSCLLHRQQLRRGVCQLLFFF